MSFWTNIYFEFIVVMFSVYFDDIFIVLSITVCSYLGLGLMSGRFQVLGGAQSSNGV